jgi:hypothetical protein
MSPTRSAVVAASLMTLTGLAWTSMSAQPSRDRPFNGLTTGVGDLHRLSKARTRSISPENFTGEKGRGGMATDGTGVKAARDLGQGWKVSPSVRIKPQQSSRWPTSRAEARFSTSG